jgi:hypothetical protein
MWRGDYGKELRGVRRGEVPCQSAYLPRGDKGTLPEIPISLLDAYRRHDTGQTGLPQSNADGVANRGPRFEDAPAAQLELSKCPSLLRKVSRKA